LIDEKRAINDIEVICDSTWGRKAWLIYRCENAAARTARSKPEYELIKTFIDDEFLV
jgi:hypothetical protein